ncbi:hypothetical protein HU200_018427 [Digitaria exilis]|uniref:Uncharacterized protein n=1 Tax=Digitaria exilis TaxID=1010633 RepID=A0A835F4D2_9POAL|nr:hypothetical protein HU200_018427 [Digitaria exilis]
MAINIISSAALWSLWKLRNNLCFQNAAWKDTSHLVERILKMAQNWIIMCPHNRVQEIQNYLSKISMVARYPEALSWRTP